MPSVLNHKLIKQINQNNDSEIENTSNILISFLKFVNSQWTEFHNKALITYNS